MIAAAAPALAEAPFRVVTAEGGIGASACGPTSSWGDCNSDGTADMVDGRNSIAIGWGDFDNDGDTGIHVASCRLDPNMLIRNDGAGQFSNASFTTGIAGNPDGSTYGHSLGADCGDVDGDGDLDLLTSGSRRFNQCDAVPKPPGCGSAAPANRDTWPQPAYLEDHPLAMIDVGKDTARGEIVIAIRN